MSLPAKYPPAVIPANWNAMVDRVNGYTPSGTFVSPYTYIISTDGTDYYASNAFQTIYGGPNDTGGVDGADPQAVLDAVLATGNVIVIKQGAYAFDIDLTGLNSIAIIGEHKNKVLITGTLTLGGDCWGCDISNLQLRDLTYTKTMLQFTASNGTSVWNNTLTNLYLQGGAVGIDWLTAGDGWINANYLQNVWLDKPVLGMTQSGYGTDYPNGNLVTNLSLQCGSGVTTAGLILPYGNGNTWVGCQVFDASAGVNRVTVLGLRNTIIGGNFDSEEFTDSGTWTNNYGFITQKLWNVERIVLSNNKSVMSWTAGNAAVRSLLRLDTSNICYLENSEGNIQIMPKDGSVITFGATGRLIDVYLALPAAATAEATLVASNKLWFYQSRFDTKVHNFYSGLSFEPYLTASGVGRMTLESVETSESAGAASVYLVVNVNGSNYKIPLHTVS